MSAGSLQARVAVRDEALSVRIVGRRRLVYTDEAPADADRPAHVRAASAVVAAGRGHLVIQDDALFVGHVDAGAVEALVLPAADGVRQFGGPRPNKAHKPDLEAACRWVDADGTAWLVAFGSGSLPARERLLVVALHDLGGARPRFVDGGALYAALRARLAPLGAELNLEGAWRTPAGHLRVLQRGNGRGGVDAAFDIDGAWLDALLGGTVAPDPVIHASARWSLGELDGTRLSFTDGAAAPGSDRWWFAAAAEASPDAVEDGDVVGSVVGWADDHGARWAQVCDERGDPVPCKLEGICAGPDGRLVGVCDPDDVERPGEWLELALDGPWPR